MTTAISKQLLPVYDKPLIYYPLATLMLAGIREILIIVTPDQEVNFRNLLGDGKKLGIELQYQIQEKPEGIPQAFTLGEEFINQQPVCLILGDNIFHGASLGRSLSENLTNIGATIFAYEVEDPSWYGVVEFSGDKAVSLEEKPKNPKSRFAVPGLYFFDGNVSKKAHKLSPSPRGETEIVDLLKTYLASGELNVIKLPRGTVWMDSGTPKGLHDAATYVRVIEERQGLKLACLEEIALIQGWIKSEDLDFQLTKMGENDYSLYLRKILDFRKSN